MKRRKVVHVITIYAAIAFVILQLVDIVSQPLHFPEWTQGFIIVLLCVAFIVTVFVSWIYDITPEGVKKTKPVSELKHGDHTTHAVSSGWKTATYVSCAIILALVAFNFISKRNLSADISKLDKSIAVLPFINDSPNDSNQYFINGIMDEVLNNLQKIKDCRVLSRTSTEQYHGSNKPTLPEIAKKLGVNYIVEGSGQKYGNTFILRVQLLTANKEKHLWGETYEKEIKEVKDYIMIPSQIAQAITAGVNASMTPDEKKLMEKVPTGNLVAYDLYLKATDYHCDYLKTGNLSSFQTATNLYKISLEIDSAFAKAYNGLAMIYFDRYYWETYFKEDYMDSCLVLTNIALSIDDQLEDSYYVKAVIYESRGQIEEALENLEKAIRINPNYYSAYKEMASIYTSLEPDFVKAIENYHNALVLMWSNERPSLLRDLSNAYRNAGFIELAKHYALNAVALDSNKVLYLDQLSWIELSNCNFEEALDLAKKAIDNDSTFFPGIMLFNLPPGHSEEAYLYASKCAEYYKKSGNLNLFESHRAGFAFWQVGKYKEAKEFFNQQIKYGEQSIKLSREIAESKSAHYDLAATFAFLGNKVDAYKYLEEFDKRTSYPLWWVSLAKNDPLFAGIRYEERFQKILQNMQTKYEAEHDRVRKWLDEQGML